MGIERFKKWKTTQGKKKKYSFSELSSALFKMEEITKEEYHFLLGRLTEADTDFIQDPKGKIYTISGAGNPEFKLWEVNKNYI